MTVPPEKRVYRLKSVGGLKGFLWRLSGRTVEAENYQLNSSVSATGVREILTQAPSGEGDFGGPGCYLPNKRHSAAQLRNDA